MHRASRRQPLSLPAYAPLAPYRQQQRNRWLCRNGPCEGKVEAPDGKCASQAHLKLPCLRHPLGVPTFGADPERIGAELADHPPVGFALGTEESNPLITSDRLAALVTVAVASRRCPPPVHGVFPSSRQICSTASLRAFLGVNRSQRFAAQRRQRGVRSRARIVITAPLGISIMPENDSPG